MLRDAKEYKGMVSDADERKGKLQNERKNTMENAEECQGLPRIMKGWSVMLRNAKKCKKEKRKKVINSLGAKLCTLKLSLEFYQLPRVDPKQLCA